MDRFETPPSHPYNEQRKQCQLSEEEARAGIATAITAYGIPLKPVSYFKYPERFLQAFDNDWSEVVRNLQRALQKWT